MVVTNTLRANPWPTCKHQQQPLSVFAICCSIVLVATMLIWPVAGHVQAYPTQGLGGAGGAGAGTMMQDSEVLVDNTVGRMQQVVYGAAGFGALALAVLAFTGNFRWVWFFSIVGGLVLIAGIQQGIQYMTGEATVINTTSN